MSATKPPKSRFGDAPAAGERRGAPLPLVTQPMVPLDDHDRSGEHTRIDNPQLRAKAIFVTDPDGTLIELVETSRSL